MSDDSSAAVKRPSGEAEAAPTSSVAPGVAAPRSEPSHYYDRKLGGKCTYDRRCQRELAPDSQLCDRHLRKERRRKAKANQAARDNNRKLGLCAFCDTKSATYRCPACAIKHGQVPPVRVAAGVADERGDQWRRDNDGWERYRGKGRRGAPGAVANDISDLKSAADAFESGRQALIYARSPRVAELGRIQRKDALLAAAAKLELAARFLLDMVDRARGVKAVEQ